MSGHGLELTSLIDEQFVCSWLLRQKVSWKFRTIQNYSNPNGKISLWVFFFLPTEWSRTGKEAAWCLLISDLNQPQLTWIGSEFHPDPFPLSHWFPFLQFPGVWAAVGVRKVLMPTRDLTWCVVNPIVAVGACVLSSLQHHLQWKETRICRQ